MVDIDVREGCQKDGLVGTGLLGWDQHVKVSKCQ